MGFFKWLFGRRSVLTKLPSKKYGCKVGLALSGGGAKGFAHIGVLRAFEEAKITFDYIAGTSAGSIVAALFAAGFDSNSIEKLGKTIKESDIKNSKIIISPSRSSNIVSLMQRFCGDMDFDDLTLPFSCVATDFVTGEEIVLDSGKLSTAVAASCSAPVFFDGVMRDGRHLVDGGLTNNLPADVVRRMGADIVVSVNLGNTGNLGTENKNLLSVLMATLSITMKSTSYKGVLNSDFVICPDLTGHKATKLIGVEEMISSGYQAAMSLMPQIKEALGIKPLVPLKSEKGHKLNKKNKHQKQIQNLSPNDVVQNESLYSTNSSDTQNSKE